jgi:tetratricopeptide (TPR) repeat protein
LLGLLAAALTGGEVLLAHVNRQTDKARVALYEGQRQLEQQHYPEALDQFRHGLALVEDLPGQGELLGNLRRGRERAECARVAGELHRFCETLRPLYGAGQVPSEQVRAVIGRCEQFWGKRDLIRQYLGAGGDEEVERRIRTDLTDLAVVWAHLRTQGQPAQAHREALALLAEAENELGPGCVLELERHLHGCVLEGSGPEKPWSPRWPARTAWEHYALGRAHFHAGDLPAARAHLEQALALEPGFLWASFYQGSCAFRLGQPVEALAAFSACVALDPGSAWCFYNRGLVYRELEQTERALQDLDRALKIDPTLAAAWLARGVIHFREKRPAQAIEDLEMADRYGLEGPAAYNLALVYLSREDRPAARTCLERALRHDREHAGARQLLQRLQASR